jgi:endonuclease/exonuclease/phosphatase family metal-dependent hydrolase
MLDYILIDETVVRQLRRYEILEEGTCYSTSDHQPVIAWVELEEDPHIDVTHAIGDTLTQ